MVHGLQSIVTCPGLESSYEEHLSALLALQDNVNSSLGRLTAFRESWTAYDFLANRLEDWIKSVSNVETNPPLSMRHFWVRMCWTLFYRLFFKLANSVMMPSTSRLQCLFLCLLILCDNEEAPIENRRPKIRAIV